MHRQADGARCSRNAIGFSTPLPERVQEATERLLYNVETRLVWRLVMPHGEALAS